MSYWIPHSEGRTLSSGWLATGMDIETFGRGCWKFGNASYSCRSAVGRGFELIAMLHPGESDDYRDSELIGHIVPFGK